MPLILVVEQEQRYVERIEEALGPQGWEVAGVDGRADAMRRVADRAADLVVVSSRVDDAAELIETFSRANGGPGVVVMVPESGDEAAQQGADEVLEKPFTDQDIRLAVRRCMSAAREASTEASSEIPAQPAERLSSEDLFGDVVLELEGAFQLGGASGATAKAEDEPAGVEPSVSEAESEAVSAAELEAAEIVEEPVEPVEEPMASAEDDVAEAIEPSPPEGIAEVEEAPEALEEEEEEPAAMAIEEAPVEEEPVEEPPAELEEPAVEAVEEEPLAEVPEVAEPEFEDVPVAVAEDSAPVEARPRKRLEDRLAEAVSEGMAAAAASDRAPADSGEDAGRVTDLLLQKALATVRPADGEEVKLDAEFTEPAHATDEEVDQLVSTVIGGRSEDEVGASDIAAVEAPAVGEAAADGWMDEEAPALDVLAPESTEGDDREYRARLKLLWAVVLIALLALLAFVLTRPKGEPEVPAPSTPVGAAARATGAEAALGGAVNSTSGETSAEREERLRQELEAESRLPQESDSREEDGARNDSEEDGGGV